MPRRPGQGPDPGVVEADDRGHGSVPPRIGRLHGAAAGTNKPDAVLERNHAGRDERAVLAHRVAGREGGRGRRDAGRGPALTERLEDRDRSGEDRGLRLLGPVERICGALPGEAADRFAERGVGRGEHGRGGRRALDQGVTHPDRLGSLAGEDEGKL